MRASLEVPGDEGSSPVVERQSRQNNISKLINNIDGTSNPIADISAVSNYDANSASTHASSSEDPSSTATISETRESLGRSNRFPARKTGPAGSSSRSGGGERSSLGNGNRNSLDSESVVENGERYGVQLSDKPMDD